MDWIDIVITTPLKYAEIAQYLANEESESGIFTEDYSNLEAEVNEIAHIDLIEKDLLLKDRSNIKIHLYTQTTKEAAKITNKLKEEFLAREIPSFFEPIGVKEEDWANEWRKYYHPRDIGRHLAVAPSWEEYSPQNRTVIKLDPGMAFGTGTHETTSLCLEILDECILGGERMLDIGTGSGILAIAAIKLGASYADAVDLDPVAVRTAKENALLNDINTGFNALEGDLSDKACGKYNVVCANIVANAIIMLSSAIPSLLAENGIFIASGIIDERCSEVEKAIISAGLVIKQIKHMNGWSAIVSALT